MAGSPPGRRCTAWILLRAGAEPGSSRARARGQVAPGRKCRAGCPPGRRCTARILLRAGARPGPSQGAGARPGSPHPGRRRAAGSPPGRRRAAGSSRAQVHGRVPARAQARSRVSPRAQVHGPDHPARRFTAWILPGAGMSEPPGQLPPAVRDRQARESVSGQRSQTGQQGRGAEAPCARCPVPVPWLTGRTSRVLARSAASCPGGGLGGAGWRLPARAGGHTLSKGSLAERPPWSSGSTSSAAVTHLGAGTVLPSDPGGGAEQESGGRSPAPQASPLTPHMWNLKTPHHRAHSE